MGVVRGGRDIRCEWGRFVSYPQYPSFEETETNPCAKARHYSDPLAIIPTKTPGKGIPLTGREPTCMERLALLAVTP